LTWRQPRAPCWQGKERRCGACSGVRLEPAHTANRQTLSGASRFSPRDGRAGREQAAAAVADLLAAAAAAEGGGGGRPGLGGGAAALGARSGADAGFRGPGRAATDAAAAAEAAGRLHALYSADDPPPIDVIRHPRVRVADATSGSEGACARGAAAKRATRPCALHALISFASVLLAADGYLLRKIACAPRCLCGTDARS